MNNLKHLGSYAFLGGVVLALAIGFFAGIMRLDSSLMGALSGVMVVLGISVGALNVTRKEVDSFIIAAIGLTAGSSALAGLGTLLAASPLTAVIGKMLYTAFIVFGTFVAGAVFVPALKSIYRLSKD